MPKRTKSLMRHNYAHLLGELRQSAGQYYPACENWLHSHLDEIVDAFTLASRYQAYDALEKKRKKSKGK